jgi:hypothetical protein
MLINFYSGFCQTNQIDIKNISDSYSFFSDFELTDRTKDLFKSNNVKSKTVVAYIPNENDSILRYYYEFDSLGRKKLYCEYSGKEKEFIKISYSYDSLNNLSKVKNSYKGKLKNIVVNHYNDKGNITRRLKFNSKDKLIMKESYSYCDTLYPIVDSVFKKGRFKYKLCYSSSIENQKVLKEYPNGRSKEIHINYYDLKEFYNSSYDTILILPYVSFLFPKSYSYKQKQVNDSTATLFLYNQQQLLRYKYVINKTSNNYYIQENWLKSNGDSYNEILMRFNKTLSLKELSCLQCTDISIEYYKNGLVKSVKMADIIYNYHYEYY